MSSYSRSFLVALTLLCTIHGLFGYKILGIFPHTGKSHHMMFEPLLRALAVKGHEVTTISHYPMKDPPSTNYRDISLYGTMHLNVHVCDFEDFLYPPLLGMFLKHVMATYELFDLANLNCRAMTQHAGVKNLIKSNETFDVIITEQFNSDCALGIMNKYKGIPSIGIATHVPMPWTNPRFGILENPSVIPNHFLKYSRKPSTLQAIESFLINAYYRFVYYISTHFLEYRFLGDDLMESRDDLDAVAKNMSLLFITTYFPLHGSFPIAPNVVEIGGIHLPNTFNNLTKELQDYLDDADDGVIYFSMGSMIRGKSLPEKQLKIFQNAFSKLPCKVLWKWENETMVDKPDNVMIRPWLPQYEILSHRNLKAFITHGGLLGLTEAVHLGVPVMVIPFFGDQFINGAAAEESGMGRVLEFEDITEERVIDILKQLLSAETQRSAKKLSEIWKDRPQTPLETATFWIEHVAKHGGGHLRPSTADLPLYRAWMLDVLSAIFIILTISTYVIIKILKALLRCFSGSGVKIKSD